jgi:hypothetical protein
MNTFLFADEAGDFNFSRRPNVSRYYIVCTVTFNSCRIGEQLLELRRQLIWEGRSLGPCFHATQDKQPVRDQVFQLIASSDLRVDATILEKSKAQSHVRKSNARFYQYAWFYHFKYVAPRILRRDTEILITAATVSTKAAQSTFSNAVNDVVSQLATSNRYKTFFCPAQADPCLQIADYCTWAIQRKWERQDSRSYDLIRDKVQHEYDSWRRGTHHYY